MPLPRTTGSPRPETAAGVPTVHCPGCGSVLAPAPGDDPTPSGVPAACTRLFEETVRGVREDAAADPQAAAVFALADAAYAAQHARTDPEQVRRTVETLAARLGEPAAPAAGRVTSPTVWRTTIADVAADLDVIDLSVLVETWARAVLADWSLSVADV
ncbi:DUF5946 family protein [Geodermatophilus sp. CPCC 205506]|uniref:DUF5946 family protein n=1 Tax=Geodermatophilus sp. CPCC 205506 TaxID=2936596 RepID=UPI003EEB164E